MERNEITVYDVGDRSIGIERAYNMVINSESDEKKKLNADFVMQWLR